MTEPTPPFRVDLATFLTEEGRSEQADARYSCECRRVVHASGFFDVRDRPDLFSRQFVCSTCCSTLRREEQAAYEVALREYQAAQGGLGEELLNDLRGRRDVALARSDWTQLLDNRVRIGGPTASLWDTYRAAVRDWFAVARDAGVIGDFPAPPGDASPSTDHVAMEPEQ